jgi:uncharacterized membrane protein (DUF485 family)
MMNNANNDDVPSGLLDWSFTVLAVVAFFLYILVIAFSPEFFAQTISSGTLISKGLVYGLLLAVFEMALAGLFIYIRNKSDRE